MTDQQYIGVIDRLSASTAWLRPLAYVDDDGSPQEDESLERSFPERGQVPWFNLNVTVTYGSLWCFRVRESPSFDPGAGRSDRYAVDGVPEKVDRRIVAHFVDVEEAREVLTIGIEASFDEKDRAFVVVGGDRLIGPLQMEHHNGLIRLDSTNRDSPINGSALSKHRVVSIGWHERRWDLLWPPRAAWTSDFQLDWGTDEAVLARGLRRLRDLASKELIASLGVTNNLISAVSARISSSNLSSVDRYRIDRATTLIKEGANDRAIVDVLVRNVLELPAVQSSIETAKRDGVAAVTAELKRREDEILGSVRTERLRLEGESSRLHKEISDLAIELSVAKDEVQGFLASVEQTIDAGLEQLMERPGEVIGKSLVLKAAMANLERRHPPLKALAATTVITKELSLSDVAYHVHTWAEYYGVSSAGALCLAASVLGGSPSVISGDLGGQAVEALRQALFGAPAGLLTLLINPGYLSPLDVIKDAQILSESQGHYEVSPALVTFDGVDRCVLESVFLPFLEERGGAALRAMLLPDRSYAIVGTLSNSSMSLPVTRRIWDYSNHLQFNRSEVASRPFRNKEMPLPGQISMDVFHAIRSSERPVGAWQAFMEYLPSMRPTAATIRRADALERSLTCLGVEAFAAVENVYCVSLIRDLADCSDKERNRLFEVLPHSDLLQRSLAIFQAGTIKREDKCTIQ